MNRNIAKPFVATLSLLDVATDKTNKYKWFHGEDADLTPLYDLADWEE